MTTTIVIAGGQLVPVTEPLSSEEERFAPAAVPGRVLRPDSRLTRTKDERESSRRTSAAFGERRTSRCASLVRVATRA
jgi:hypothetical protein